MTRFYEPDLTANSDSPFVRDASNKLVRRGYWMDVPESTLVMVMTQGIGANLTNDEKRAHLIPFLNLAISEMQQTSHWPTHRWNVMSE